MRNIILLTSAPEKDQEIVNWLQQEKDADGNQVYTIHTVVYEGNVENTISEIKNLGEDILDSCILVRGNISGISFAMISMAFVANDKRAYHTYYFERHNTKFALIDSLYKQPSEGIQQQIIDDYKVYYEPLAKIYLCYEGDFDYAVDNEHGITRDTALQNIAGMTTLNDFLHRKEEKKVLLFDTLKMASFVANYFLEKKGWVARGFVRGLVFPCVFMSCKCNPKSVLYAVRQLEEENKNKVMVG